MFDAKPEDRDTFAVYILALEIDHKAGPDGTMIPYERITIGKKGAPNWQSELDVRRLERDDPAVYQHFLPTIEKWRKTNTIATEGVPLEAWPAISKGQLRALKNLGLRSVEDVSEANDLIREKFGMGFLDLKKQAKAYLQNYSKQQAAKKLTDQEDAIADLKAQLKEAQETIQALAAKAGLKEQRPLLQEKAA